ncbi:MAG: hypothetical protein LQ351_007925 [Letrouitia transgressa]|nr:MAG: hypothetical protein LQ351_007925 [Letrouitia transgressa]
MDPKGPSQPPLDTAYDQPSNPATQTESEEQYSKSTSASIQRSDPVVDRRERGDVPVPSQHEEAAVPSSLGYGVRDDRHDAGESKGSPVSDLTGEQMRAPGEGDIAQAQHTKQGFGEQPDLASDLDKKKEDQQRRLQERDYGNEAEKSGSLGEVDVKSAVGGSGKGVVGVAKGSGGRGAGEGLEGGGRGLEGLGDV